MPIEKTTSFHGGCLCGKITFRIDGEFDALYMCHCSRCRKDTGSAHSCSLSARSAELTWMQGENFIKQYCTPGTRHTINFCTQCGSPLPVSLKDLKIIVTPAGSLDDPPNIKVKAHINWASKAPWDDNLHEAEKYEQYPKQWA